jgi:uncharacterized FlaG/YvyC family protein
MDTQAVNSAGNPKAPPPKTQSSTASSKPVSDSVPDPKPSGDAVSLSAQAKALAQTSKGGQTLSNSEQRKLSVTDDNDVVLKVIDPKTQEVVKSIPSEEQIQLKIAIRDGVSDITE